MLKYHKPAVDSTAIATDLQVLANSSKILNHLTDELTKHVEHIESSVNALNLGLRAFVIAESASDEDGRRSHDVRLCYEKIDGKWGLAIDEYDEDAADPVHCSNYSHWAFKDAPRALRLKVVPKIPDLIKALIKEAEKMTAETGETVSRALEIAISLSKTPTAKSGSDIPTWVPPGPGK
jgi:hypothetical protein